jgi:hypothetical protein
MCGRVPITSFSKSSLKPFITERTSIKVQTLINTPQNANATEKDGRNLYLFERV